MRDIDSPQLASALTVCPPSRLSVRLLRHVSVSVRPHRRSSPSTVKTLLSQGCRHGSSHSAQRCPPPPAASNPWTPCGVAPGAGAQMQQTQQPGQGWASRAAVAQSRRVGARPRSHLGQHVAAVPVHRVLPLVERGDVGAPQHRAGAWARQLPAAPLASGAGAVDGRDHACAAPGGVQPPACAPAGGHRSGPGPPASLPRPAPGGVCVGSPGHAWGPQEERTAGPWASAP